jgi:hypothetical protein
MKLFITTTLGEKATLTTNADYHGCRDTLLATLSNRVQEARRDFHSEVSKWLRTKAYLKGYLVKMLSVQVTMYKSYTPLSSIELIINNLFQAEKPAYKISVKEVDKEYCVSFDIIFTAKADTSGPTKTKAALDWVFVEETAPNFQLVHYILGLARDSKKFPKLTLDTLNYARTFVLQDNLYMGLLSYSKQWGYTSARYIELNSSKTNLSAATGYWSIHPEHELRNEYIGPRNCVRGLVLKLRNLVYIACNDPVFIKVMSNFIPAL